MFTSEIEQEIVCEAKESDFNQWLLGDTDGNQDKWNQKTNKVLMSNLLYEFQVFILLMSNLVERRRNHYKVSFKVELACAVLSND